MSSWLIAHEPGFRLAVFATVFAMMAIWELAAARRELALPKGQRWIGNLLLVAVDTIIVRLVFPAAAVGAAALAAQREWGLFQRVEWSPLVEVAASILLLDLAIYLQHVMFHAVPALWRLHMVHHADLDFDVTTGLRFHPFEILASMGLKIAMVFLLGPSVLAVLLFEVVLNATSMFNHGNVQLANRIDAVLRWLVVTPDMHRVHHSVEPAEANSNFGFNLPWWDRLFGTYRARPAAGHRGMRIGVEHLQQPRPQGLLWLLGLPFSTRSGRYPIDRRGPSSPSEGSR